MRVAFVTHQWPGARMGGIGAYVRQCAAALAAAGHEPHVFTFTLPDDVRQTTIPPGVVVHECADLASRVHAGSLPPALGAIVNAGGEGAYRLALGCLLAEQVVSVHRESPFDVVEAPDIEALGLPLVLNPAAAGLPVVTHLHCCTAIAQAANDVPAHDEAPLVRALEFAAIATADAVCAPTNAVVELTRRYLPVADDARIIRHPFVCGAESFSPPSAGGPVVFVGRVERLKGCGVLAEALNTFLAGNPDASFRFVGPDTNTAAGGRSMISHIRATLSPAVAERVTFTGELPAADVARELRACRFAVLPSLCENFSMAVCEAMAAGRAVIVGSGTGSAEVVGAAGVVAASGDAVDLAGHMERLWRDRPALLDLSRRSYEHVRRACDPAQLAAERIGFYRGVTAAFARHGRASLPDRLAALPPAVAAALLPAVVRLTAAAAQAPLASVTPGTRLRAIFDELAASTGAPTVTVALYGAGKHTARLLAERHAWESRGHRVAALVDDHPRFRESPSHLGLPVRSLSDLTSLAREGKPVPPVVLSTDNYEDLFWQQTAPLREAGVRVFRLYSSPSNHEVRVA